MKFTKGRIESREIAKRSAMAPSQHLYQYDLADELVDYWEKIVRDLVESRHTDVEGGLCEGCAARARAMEVIREV